MIRISLLLLCFLALSPTTATLMAAQDVESTVPGQQPGTTDHKEKTEMARVLISQGKLDEAELLLRQTLKLTPDPVEIYYELGRIHVKRGDSVGAIAAFKEGIKIHEQGRRRSP